jgi:DNA-binding HxlR family transcriptional regulator
MKPSGDHCSFTKAVEHLGDRWSLLIVRELVIHGPLGFNALAATLPSISRSVLARRLRKLEELGIIERSARSAAARPAPHRLTPAGEQLVPTLMSLKSWAARWVPEDPAMVQRDPDVILLWMAHRADPSTAPERRAVLEFEFGGPRAKRAWLVVERGAVPSICFDDPDLPPERYVHVEADATSLYPISRGLRTWASAIADESVALYGDPDLVRAMPDWFGSGDSMPGPASAAATDNTRALAVAG